MVLKMAPVGGSRRYENTIHPTNTARKVSHLLPRIWLNALTMTAISDCLQYHVAAGRNTAEVVQGLHSALCAPGDQRAFHREERNQAFVVHRRCRARPATGYCF